jgi:hypothetical protein
MTYNDCPRNPSVVEVLASIICHSSNVRLIQISRPSGRPPVVFFRDLVVAQVPMYKLCEHSIRQALGLVNCE